MRRIIVAFFISLCASGPLHAQGTTSPDQVLEKYLENVEGNADYTQLAENLSAFKESPVKINFATLEELQNFPLLSAAQAVAIIAHREKYGPFLHLNELQVLGFEPDFIRQIAPYLSLDLDISQQWKNMRKCLTLGTRETVIGSKWKSPVALPVGALGNAWGQSVRIRYAKPNLYSMGFSMEKDAGEKYWNKGPDFVSAHISVQQVGMIKSAVLGDYVLNLGQGLIIGSGIGAAKGAMVLNIKRNAPVLKPYRGLNEFYFLRGAACHLQMKKWQLVMAASLNSADARKGDSMVQGEMTYASVDMDGLHRTANEIAGKGMLKSAMAGTWALRNSRRGMLGFGANHWHTNLYQMASPEWYKLYYPSGKNLDFAHVFQAHTLGRWHVFSEWAHCFTNQRSAVVMGALGTLGRRLEMSFLYRNYQSGFISNMATPFGNSPQNEKGLYLGMQLHISKKWLLAHYTDIWKNPWLGYQKYSLTMGTDMLWQLEYAPLKNAQVYLRVRNSTKPINWSGSEPVKRVDDNRSQNIRLHMNAALTTGMELQLRAESAASGTAVANYNAFMAFAQVGGKIKRSRTQIAARFSQYNVPFYYARIYAFESQLAYDFGTVAFYGKGTAAYVLINQALPGKWKLGIRMASSATILPGETAVQRKQSIFVQLFQRI